MLPGRNIYRMRWFRLLVTICRQFQINLTNIHPNPKVLFGGFVFCVQQAFCDKRGFFKADVVWCR